MGRLGSALQSWTGRAGGDTSGREGRPGPLGAKYTTEPHAAPGWSPFEAPPHQQLRERLPVESAFAVAALRGICDNRGLRQIGVSAGKGSSPVADGVGRLFSEHGDAVEGTRSRESERRGGVQGEKEGEKEENQEDTGTSTTEKDKKGPQTGGGEAAAPPSCLAHLVVGSGASEAGAEAGAGSTYGGTHTNNPPSCASAEEGGVDGSEGGTRGQQSRVKTPGLWELKADRSRLEQALVEAERDRDVEKLRSTEAAFRLKEAVARLESLRGGRGVVFVR